MATKPARHVSLPVAGERVERADAARNRERILQAARKLIARRGVRAISLDDVVAEAGVGRATLFRRFPDRAALLLALLDEHERELQDAILEGEPPLGPGAPAARRLLAFGEALLDLTLDHLDLAALLPELRPDADPNVLADVILALYDAELQQFLAEERDPRAVRELLLDSVRRLAGI